MIWAIAPCLVTGLAAGDDRIKPSSVLARHRQVGRLAPNTGEGVLVRHRLKVGEVAQLISVAAAAGVDELNAACHGLDLVSIKVTLTAVTGAE